MRPKTWDTDFLVKDLKRLYIMFICITTYNNQYNQQ